MGSNYLLNPQTYAGEHHDDETITMFKSIINYYEEKGLSKLNEDDADYKVCYDMLKYQAKNQIFARLLTPKEHGDENSYFDLRRITEFNELLAFYGIGNRYPFQVTMLGLAPIWMGTNKKVQKWAAQKLKEGRIFAYGISEKEHGADLYSNEMCVSELPDGNFRADGSKYYIGFSNVAITTTFAKLKGTAEEWVLFAADSQHPHYNDVKRIRTSTYGSGYVGEYRLVDYPVNKEHIYAFGKKAWEEALAAINIGKFMVGVSPIGICTHSLYESLRHSHSRILYGKKVTAMPHIRRFYSEAYLRLLGMRLYVYRACDYFRCSSSEDRRYLLYNPIVKMKTGLEGVKVMTNILDAASAKAFEKDTYTETATRDIQGPPRLEGTAHVNMSLVIKCIESFFSNHVDYPDIPVRVDLCDDNNLFNQKYGSIASIRFNDYSRTFTKFLDIPNVAQLYKQSEILGKLFLECPIEKSLKKQIDYMLNLGHMLVMVVYGQLILEGACNNQIHKRTINQLFGLYVFDMAAYALEQISKHAMSDQQVSLLKQIAGTTPVIDIEQWNAVWTEDVEPLNDAFLMPE